jgi:hypothetical protein
MKNLKKKYIIMNIFEKHLGLIQLICYSISKILGLTIMLYILRDTFIFYDPLPPPFSLVPPPNPPFPPPFGFPPPRTFWEIFVDFIYEDFFNFTLDRYSFSFR